MVEVLWHSGQENVPRKKALLGEHIVFQSSAVSLGSPEGSWALMLLQAARVPLSSAPPQFWSELSWLSKAKVMNLLSVDMGFNQSKQDASTKHLSHLQDNQWPSKQALKLCPDHVMKALHLGSHVDDRSDQTPWQPCSHLSHVLYWPAGS